MVFDRIKNRISKFLFHYLLRMRELLGFDRYLHSSMTQYEIFVWCLLVTSCSSAQETCMRGRERCAHWPGVHGAAQGRGVRGVSRSCCRPRAERPGISASLHVSAGLPSFSSPPPWASVLSTLCGPRLLAPAWPDQKQRPHAL